MKKTKSNAYKTSINLITSIAVLIINLCISFVLSPYIIRTIGVEANGFVSLANTFVSYANIAVTALNAMAARFITVEYVRGNHEKANMYYNSVFWGNLIIVAVLLIPSILFVGRLEFFTDVPSDILWDVKICFAMVFGLFFIRTGAPNYDCGTYVTNRLDLSYIPNMLSTIIRAILLVSMFILFSPHIWYVTLTSFITGIMVLLIAAHNTHKLTPELKINLRHPICSGKMIKELVGSGIWNSISSTGYILMNGLDLLLCNIYLGATKMGILSLAKTLPSIVGQLADAILGAFGPELTINYALDDTEAIKKSIKRAMKISALLVSVPAAGVVVMGDAFYSLWVPTLDAQLLRILSTLTFLSLLLTSGVVILQNVFTTVNKAMYNSIGMIISGVISIFITLMIMIFTDYDIYAVAGVSSIVTICKNMFYVLPITSKFLGFKWNTFYPQVGISMLSAGVIIFIGIIVRMILPCNTWITFLICSSIIGIAGVIANLFIVFNKDERIYFINIIKRKLHRR